MQLHNARKQFEEIGIQVVLIGLGTAEQTEKFKAELSISFPIICDPQKELYRQYGLGRGGIFSVVSPIVLLKGMRTFSHGYKPGIPQGDIMQMPGVFLINSDGEILYSHYSKDASDHPSIDTLLSLKKILK